MKKYRLAIVDDHKAMLSALVEMLTSDGFEVQGFDEAEKMLAGGLPILFPSS